MDWTSEKTAILSLIVTNIVTMYYHYRRQNRRDKEADAVIDTEHQDGVIAQWVTWGRQQARERLAERVRGDKLAELNADYRSTIARQEEHIRNLVLDIARLKGVDP